MIYPVDSVIQPLNNRGLVANHWPYGMISIVAGKANSVKSFLWMAGTWSWKRVFYLEVLLICISKLIDTVKSQNYRIHVENLPSLVWWFTGQSAEAYPWEVTFCARFAISV